VTLALLIEGAFASDDSSWGGDFGSFALGLAPKLDEV
jgi:hypothetical protein